MVVLLSVVIVVAIDDVAEAKEQLADAVATDLRAPLAPNDVRGVSFKNVTDLCRLVLLGLCLYLMIVVQQFGRLVALLNRN